MNEQNKTRLLVTVFSMSQVVLQEYGLVQKTGEPFKLRKKDQRERNLDALYIYEWASLQVKYVPQSTISRIGIEINEMAQSLSDNYMMNKYLFVLFLFEKYLINEADGITRNLMLPKVERLIRLLRNEIVSIEGATKEEIIKDSATLSSNMWNLLNEKVELTKEIRAARVRMWLEAKRNKPKEKKSILNKYKF